MEILSLLALGTILTTMSLCKAASRADNFEENMMSRENEAYCKEQIGRDDRT